MSPTIRRVCTSTNSLHSNMKALADAVGKLLVDAFHLLALFVIGATTVWSAVVTFIGLVTQGYAQLGDILLLFIYLEIGPMVGIYFKTTHLPARSPLSPPITPLRPPPIEIVTPHHRT